MKGVLVGFVFLYGQTLLLPSLQDTQVGIAPSYLPGYQPWFDPLDTIAAFCSRTGYFKPYLLWRQGILAYEEAFSPFPQSQAAYLLTEVPLIRSSPPYTRVRFDQSSRRTQLLLVEHGQTFARQGGVSLAYRRRTREGEYVGQATDHFAAGLRGYFLKGKWGVEGTLLWNQLADALNGGIVYDSVEGPWSAFGKEQQPVRLTRSRWRRWHRTAHLRMQFAFAPTSSLYLESSYTQEHFHPESGGGLPQSPFLPDSLPFSWSLTTQTYRLSTGIESRRLTTRLRLGRTRGHSMLLLRPWNYVFAEAYLRLTLPLGSVEGEVRKWLSQGAPPLTGYVQAVALYRKFAVGARLQSRNLPWLVYQRFSANRTPNEFILQGWSEYTLARGDSTLRPLRLRAWATFWRFPWRWEALPSTGAPQIAYGLTAEGGWLSKRWGFLGAATLQQVHTADLWRQTLPPAYGWLQPFLRWKLPGRIPQYEVGVRLSGFLSFRPLSYDPLLGIFYLRPTVPLQPGYAWADPYFALLIKRVIIFLRVEHATEGLWQAGYYLTAWYPMPGRAFAFGVQWDLYN